MSEDQGTTQDGTKTSYQREELRFSFEGKQAGDYLLAFILHKNGVSQPIANSVGKSSMKLMSFNVR